MTAFGLCYDRTFPAGEVTRFAREIEAAGLDQLWVIEDCFYTSGISLAAASLAATERLEVGLGILPAVARTPAITAMEIATLDAIAPGRVVPGVGHGVQDWMEQMGVRPTSPLTTLEEVITVVRRLLRGETVTFEGKAVTHTDVALDRPPAIPPPVLAGVQGPKSLAVAGRIADGLVLAEWAGPTYIRWALDQSGRPDPFEVVVFTALCVEDDRIDAYRSMADWLAGAIGENRPSLTCLPFYDDMHARLTAQGTDGLVTMPPDWWRELGAIGTSDDAAHHVAAVSAAGADRISFFPSPVFDEAFDAIEVAATVFAALR